MYFNEVNKMRHKMASTLEHGPIHYFLFLYISFLQLLKLLQMLQYILI